MLWLKFAVGILRLTLLQLSADSSCSCQWQRSCDLALYWFTTRTENVNASVCPYKFKYWICGEGHKNIAEVNVSGSKWGHDLIGTIDMMSHNHGWPSNSRAACTQPCNVNTHSRAHCSPGARLCEQWGHGCVNNGARLCASARLCRGSPVIIYAHDFVLLYFFNAFYRLLVNCHGFFPHPICVLYVSSTFHLYHTLRSFFMQSANSLRLMLFVCSVCDSKK